MEKGFDELTIAADIAKQCTRPIHCLATSFYLLIFN